MPDRVVRDMGCTPADLIRWMPEATAHRPIAWRDDGCAVAVDGGRVVFTWTVLPPRRIALVRIERLELEIVFEGCAPERRRSFLARFDDYTRRGGG